MASTDKILDASELIYSLEQMQKKIDNFGVVDVRNNRMLDDLLKENAKRLQGKIQLTANTAVTRRTGHFHDNIVVGKLYTFEGKRAIRVIAKAPARHANLLEYGHKMPNGGSASAFNIFQNGFDNAKEEIAKNIEDTFIRELEKIVR